jgi:hypothetical protein
MTKSPRRFALVALLALTALLSIGVTSAFAHGGRGGPGLLRAADTDDLVAAAAGKLGVSTATLTKAIRDAAVARIDEAVTDGDIDADDADDLKDEVADNLGYAMAVSRAKTVAANAGKTTAQLNTAFREARKAEIAARIDQAVEDGDLDADDAADLKERLADAVLPGYKPVSFGFGLGGFGLGGPRGGHGFGRF